MINYTGIRAVICIMLVHYVAKKTMIIPA